MKLSNKLENILRNNVKFDESAPWSYFVYINKHIPHGHDVLRVKVEDIERFAERNHGYCKTLSNPYISGDNLAVRIEMNCDCVAAKAFNTVIEEKERQYIYLSVDKETAVWCAGTLASGTDNHPVRFCEEKDYPVDLYYVRTDINGSSSVEKETCESRKDLIKALNWLGECGYTPLKVWDFNVETTRNEKALEIINAGAKARAEKGELSLEEKIADAIAMGKKEYSLILCKGEPEEETVKAYLTDQEVVLIKKDLSGELNTGINIELADGREIEIGIIDEMAVAEENKARDREER